MNNELGLMWKEMVMTYFKALPQHLLAGTKDNHNKLH
jgi:hypothetical protein